MTDIVLKRRPWPSRLWRIYCGLRDLGHGRWRYAKWAVQFARTPKSNALPQSTVNSAP